MNMIKKTQYKFIAITLCAITLVLVLILGILNACVYVAIIFSGRENIELIRERRGFIYSNESIDGYPVHPDFALDNMKNSEGKIEYMYVRINNNGASSPFITTNMSDTYTADEIYYLADMLIKSDVKKGIYNSLLYEVTDDGLYSVVVITDVSADLSLMRSLFRISVVIIICSLVFVYIFSYYLSRWAVKPVKNALENQRRFISDASHELKTPLTVISANADVLETEIGVNKWLENIKSQSEIMSSLVHDLLNLAKMDEIHEEIVFSSFDLSSVVLSKTLEFECTAFESGKRFEQNITDGITYNGNEDMIKHLVTILIDNAIKHSDENGIIRVTLTTAGNKKIFQVYNTGNGIKNSEKDKIFNRFYRSDESRSKATGGYGLGLSIAKSIVEAHKGTITVDGEENKWVSFTAIL
ncbi:MAG: HAMP domain-containing histidine kinase [Clostridia bacterium]|nr:HAMP domain-containing histidine kinase [Clostridia bacterium]